MVVPPLWMIAAAIVIGMLLFLVMSGIAFLLLAHSVRPAGEISKR